MVASRTLQGPEIERDGKADRALYSKMSRDRRFDHKPGSNFALSNLGRKAVAENSAAYDEALKKTLAEASR